MLFATALEAAFHGEEQTQTNPENGCATRQEASWNKFSSCWATFQLTTERYLGCKQRFRNAVNDHIGLEPAPPS